MGEQTKIEWCHHTFNPWIGCTKLSEGCAHCYAADLDARYWGGNHWGPGMPRKITSESYWRQPRQWNEAARVAGERRRVFCASLADVFDMEAPPGLLDRLWNQIRQTPHLDWLLLTKRPQRVLEVLPIDIFTNFRPNVWLGFSAENQQRRDERSSHAAAWRGAGWRGITFVSAEPLLGPLDVRLATGGPLPIGDAGGSVTVRPRVVDWIITGGESGNGARPIDVDWFRSLRDQCAAAGVAFFMKQMGQRYAQRMGRPNHDKGGDLDLIPEDLRIREFPRLGVPA